MITTARAQACLERYNTHHAVRTYVCVVNVQERKSAKIKGRGRYRCWTADAILRVCFGLEKVRRYRQQLHGPERLVANATVWLLAASLRW